MDYLYNIIEYFDELYPSSAEQKVFFEALMQRYIVPAKILRIGCGTGSFEHFLARAGHDVTGIETSKEMLETANLRRRMPNTAVRFFQMTTIEMSRFLGKKFYNIISCLNDNLIFIHDKTLMRKFFYDCRSLLTDDGSLVLQLLNFDNYQAHPVAALPTRESIRSKLFSRIRFEGEDLYYFDQDLETSSGKVVPVLRDVKVFPIGPAEIESYAREVGFKQIHFYEDYTRKEFTVQSRKLLCVIN